MVGDPSKTLLLCSQALLEIRKKLAYFLIFKRMSYPAPPPHLECSGRHPSADSYSERHFVKQNFLTGKVHLGDEVWDWEQQLRGFPSSALSFSGEENGGRETWSICPFSLPRGFRAGSQLCGVLHTLEILFAMASAPICLVSLQGQKSQKGGESRQAGRGAPRFFC